ncbi:RAC-gamma serine/threonine-protein kinase [Rhizophlyctis rosea]|nr:RAC-gamma serine/threonine-protein kinase [Rhizophlyctis rosea]
MDSRPPNLAVPASFAGPPSKGIDDRGGKGTQSSPSSRPSSRPPSRPLSPQVSASGNGTRKPPSVALPDTPAPNEGPTYWLLQGTIAADSDDEDGGRAFNSKSMKQMSASQETITREHFGAEGAYGTPSRSDDPSPRSQKAALRVAIPITSHTDDATIARPSPRHDIYQRAAATIAASSYSGPSKPPSRNSISVARSSTYSGPPMGASGSSTSITTGPQHYVHRRSNSISSGSPSSHSTLLTASNSTTFLQHPSTYTPTLPPQPVSPISPTMPLIPAPPLPYSISTQQRKRLATVPRKTGNVAVFMYTEDDACNMFVVSPDTTVNEVRMDALVKLGYAELTESFRVFHMEVGSDGGFFVVEAVWQATPSKPADTFTSLSTAPSLKLRMRRKSTIKWNVAVHVEKKGVRNVLVDQDMTVEDVLRVLFCVEGIDEGERGEWGLWKEGTGVGDNVISRPMALKWNDRPFEPWERTVKFLFRRMAAKRAAKLSSVLGIPSYLDPHSLMDKGADMAQDVKRRNEAYRSAKLTKMLGITSNDKKITTEEALSGVAETSSLPFPPREKRPPMRLETFDSLVLAWVLVWGARVAVGGGEREEGGGSEVGAGMEKEKEKEKEKGEAENGGWKFGMPATPNTPTWKLDALEADLLRTMSALSVNEDEVQTLPSLSSYGPLSRSASNLMTSAPSQSLPHRPASTSSRTANTSSTTILPSRSAELLSTKSSQPSAGTFSSTVGMGPRSASAVESSLSVADNVPGLPSEVGGKPWGRGGGVRTSFSSENFQTLVKQQEQRRTSAASILSTSTTSSIGEPKEPAKRTTGKLAEFFGVQKGQKEMDEIRKIVIRNQEQRVSILPEEKEKNTFVVRIYFGNLTYTSISLPITTGNAGAAIKQLLEKLNIKENSEQYAVFEYQQSSGAEREVRPDEKMYDIMRGWENNEIFVFKRRSTKNLLRHKPLLHTESTDSHTESITAVTENHHPAKRVAKLAGFFGVQPRPMPTGPTAAVVPPAQEKEKGARRNEVLDLYKMLNVMSDDGGAFKKAVLEKKMMQVDKIYKEGWLHKYNPTKRTFTPHWGKIENCTLTLRQTESKDEVIPSLPSAPAFPATSPTSPTSPQTPAPNPDTPSGNGPRASQTTIVISLQSCAVESAPMSYFKRPAFQLMENNGEKHSFAVGSVQEVEEWVNSIKVSSRLAGRKAHAELRVGEYVGQGEGGGLNRVGSMEEEGGEDAEGGIGGRRTMERRATAKMSIADFEIHKVLGRGKFAKVLLCSQKSTQRVYAIKVLHKHSGDDDNSRKESQILRSVQHPFIVGLYYAFQSKERLYLVMEYVNGGELYFHVSNFGRFSEERVRFYGAEIALAVGYLHEKDVVYRDLKLENILLAKDGHVKITDFGLSKQEDDMDDDMSTVSIVGTLEYLAPEVLEGLENSFAADWWAYGVVLFEMLCGFHPFYSDDREAIRDNILYADIEYPHHVTPDARDLITKLLNRNPMRRLGCGEKKGKEVLGHGFYSSVDFGRLYRKEIEPPFKPELTDDFDVSFFDELFTTEEPVLLTPTESNEDLAGMVTQDVDGFSFRGHSFLDLPYDG